jgi:hypothetical protein
MKTVLLAKGEEAFVDDEDYEAVRATKWWLLRTKSGKLYAYRPVRKESGQYSTVLMHRIIMGALPRQLVDHEDGNGLNNQRGNLRVCTTSQNNANKAALKHSSQYKGVSWSKAKKKWQAYIKISGKSKFLGYFVDEAVAAKKYDEAAIATFGEFARPNFGRDKA